jgi:hypothetical protein
MICLRFGDWKRDGGAVSEIRWVFRGFPVLGVGHYSEV